MALNQAALNVEVINGVPPGTRYNKAVTATATVITSFLKQARTIKSIVSTSTARIVRGVRKLITYTSTSTTTVRKAITQTARSVVSTSTARILKQYYRVLTSTIVISTETLTKAVRKLVVASQNTTSTISKRIGKLLNVSSTSVLNISKRVSKSFSVSSISVNSIKKGLARVLVISSSTISTVIKQIRKTLITLGTKTVMTGSLNGPVFNERTINADDPTYTTTTGITSTATVSVNSLYYKLLTVLSATTNTINRAVTRTKVLIANLVVSISSLVKVVQVALNSYVDTIVDLFKQVKLTLIVLGNKYVMTGTLGSALYNQLTINTDDPIYTTTTGITSTATVSVKSIYYRVLTVLSTSINSLIAAFIKLKVLTVTVSSSVIKLSLVLKDFISDSLIDTFTVLKKVSKTFIVRGTKTVMSGTLNGPVFNERTINTDDPTYTETTGITSTATLATKSLYFRIITLIVTSLSTIAKARLTYKTLVSNTVTSLVKLVKQAQVTLYSNLDTIIDFNYFTNRLVLLTVSVISTCSLVFAQFFFKTLSALSTTISTVQRARVKILQVLVTSYSTISKVCRKIVAVIVSSLSTILTVVVYFNGLLSKIYIYAEDRVRSIPVKKFRTILVDKIRTVFITKDDIV
jgi:hypothetical protein